jgi:phage N-6-adenine-methyltransferase
MPKNNANHTETRRDDWGTPKDLFESLNNVFNFAVDLAADANNTLCPDYCSKEEDDNGFFDCSSKVFEHLVDRWCWCNPPYGESKNSLAHWITEISERVPKTLVLIPSATGNKWWHTVVWPKAKFIIFIRGRLQFEGAPQVAQFDSVLLALGYKASFNDTSIAERIKLLEFGVLVKGWYVD